MSVPTPSKPLDGHCSVIDNDTLYVLSSTSFQALPLKEHAQWSTLPIGEAVSSPACVRAVPNGDESQAALYVVGGVSQSESYPGLQRYVFSSKTWETLTPPALDMQSRTNHSVAYLDDSSSILVYAGSQPQAESALSSQTFCISTSPPYNLVSYTSEAPPASNPILLPWNSTSAVMLGGSSDNTAIWTFTPGGDGEGNWNSLKTRLAEPLGPQVRATVADGSDGSKVLETYDASVSPNQVSQIVLLGAGGSTAATGQTIGGSSRKRKRDHTLQNWPKYNSSDAPSQIRSTYSVAQGSDGTSVISGGSDSNPYNLFNENTNSWVDNGLFFTGRSNNNQAPLLSSSTSASATPSATSSPSTSPTSSLSAASSSANSLTGDQSHRRMEEVLGITLGVLCGIAAIFICILLYLRWRRQKRQKQGQYVNEKPDRMSFQDRGASWNKEAGGSVANLPNQFDADRNGNHKSLAIISGKVGHRSQDRFDRRDSSESQRQLVSPRKKEYQVHCAPRESTELDDWNQVPVTRKPVARQEPTVPAAEGASLGVAGAAMMGDKKRSSGWSRYFAPNEPQLPAAYSTSQHASSATQASHYTTTDSDRPDMPSRIPSSVLVPPLDLGFGEGLGGNHRFSNVNAKSPSFNHSSEDLALRGSSIDAARGQRGHIHGAGLDANRVPSRGHESFISDDSRVSDQSISEIGSDFGSSNYYGGEHSAASTWTPVSSNQKNPRMMDSSHSGAMPRPPSSNYTSSVYGNNAIPASRGGGGGAGFFPGNRDNYGGTASSRQQRVRSPTSPTFPLPPGTVGNPIRVRSPTMGLASAKTGLRPETSPKERESTMTVFPRGVPSAYYADRRDQDKENGNAAPAKNIPPQDMSWLNLGWK